ncbi:Putative peptidoglycan binding domain-containing protein [Rhodoblastus acidophilus]|uniref:Putative peptidoglycan binding domain-containing protein n=1 Tax=Rhodoblastus acidophilus TaxID=1074 RepID=A0A212QPE8_RHOAC|nr:peptidoglycan-binding domain-containing protein [Rhodoblastus acidophilus]PPQ34890.1 hypothetical protein CKO16_21665 [Rhodoblastus acidophilus]RAI16467.1 hypothetical protein CH337_21210 [Rhodoblastus acidophilus]SNB61305.1 Putative peptidoglycan binding domain-containing protein [Rhodoblastus acidophilus]
MREIAAASDFDFVASEPAPTPKRTRAAGRSRAQSPSASPQWLSRIWVWRTPVFGGVAFVALLATIAVNAMFLQHGRHPAPLMGSVLHIETPKAEPAPVVRAEPAAPVPSALDEALTPAPLASPVAPAKAAKTAAPAPVAPAKAVMAPKPVAPVKAVATAKLGASGNATAVAKAPAAPKPAAKSGDAIGALMDKSAAPAADNKVSSAQKALNKLGAHVSANGKFDDATRKAVQKFQRDNGLPATGELTPALRHYLALQAGLPVD